jgi:hypothetical protein
MTFVAFLATEYDEVLSGYQPGQMVDLADSPRELHHVHYHVHQPRINIIKDENGNLLPDPKSVNRWKIFFNQVLNVHGAHDVRQKDIHRAEPLMPVPNLVKVEIAIGKLKSCKSPGSDQILAELIKAGGETLYSEVHRHICSIWNKEKLPQQCGRNLLLYQFIKRVIRLIVIIIKESASYQLPTKFYPTFFWPG